MSSQLTTLDKNNLELRERVINLERENGEKDRLLVNLSRDFRELQQKVGRTQAVGTPPTSRHFSSSSTPQTAKKSAGEDIETPSMKIRRKDYNPDSSADDDRFTETYLRRCLQADTPDSRLAKRGPNDMFRFLIKHQYMSDMLIVDLKLPPIKGAKKVDFEKFNRGEGNYMSKKVEAALIKIVGDHFPNSFESVNRNRDIRKKLSSCLDYLTAKLKSEQAENGRGAPLAAAAVAVPHSNSASVSYNYDTVA